MGSVMVKSAQVPIPSSLSLPLMLLSGRWTREEHQLFVKGLELYGKGWKKIASLIKTRTVVQIRTHAQKYFLKLSKARQNGELAGGLGQYGFRKVILLIAGRVFDSDRSYFSCRGVQSAAVAIVPSPSLKCFSHF